MPSYVSRKVNGVWTALLIKTSEELKCPYCGSENLELEISYDSVISGQHVDWYTCAGCGWDVEVVDGVTQRVEDAA